MEKYALNISKSIQPYSFFLSSISVDKVQSYKLRFTSLQFLFPQFEYSNIIQVHNIKLSQSWRIAESKTCIRIKFLSKTRSYARLKSYHRLDYTGLNPKQDSHTTIFPKYLYVSTQRSDITQLRKPSCQNLSLTKESDYLQRLVKHFLCSK